MHSGWTSPGASRATGRRPPPPPHRLSPCLIHTELEHFSAAVSASPLWIVNIPERSESNCPHRFLSIKARRRAVPQARRGRARSARGLDGPLRVQVPRCCTASLYLAAAPHHCTSALYLVTVPRHFTSSLCLIVAAKTELCAPSGTPAVGAAAPTAQQQGSEAARDAAAARVAAAANQGAAAEVGEGSPASPLCATARPRHTRYSVCEYIRCLPCLKRRCDRNPQVGATRAMAEAEASSPRRAFVDHAAAAAHQASAEMAVRCRTARSAPLRRTLLGEAALRRGRRVAR